MTPNIRGRSVLALLPLASLWSCGAGGGSAGAGADAAPNAPVPAAPAPAAGAPVADERQAELGVCTRLNALSVFPGDNAWNQDISAAEVDPNSDRYLAALGVDRNLHPDFGSGTWNGAPIGIPYVVVAGNQPKVPVRFEYADESDPGPYPIPSNAPIEGGPDSEGDRHVIVVDRDAKKLYELFAARPNGDGSWQAGSGAVFDLTSNALRPQFWTSADAAGLPIFPGLVRYDEVMGRGEINHALRFTVQRTRRAFVHPARHWASQSRDANLLPMGARLRLKSSFTIPASWPQEAQVIARALQRYGMILADNGSTFYLSGSPDERWDNDKLAFLKRIKGSDLEVVKLGEVVSD